MRSTRIISTSQHGPLPPGNIAPLMAWPKMARPTVEPTEPDTNATKQKRLRPATNGVSKKAKKSWAWAFLHQFSPALSLWRTSRPTRPALPVRCPYSALQGLLSLPMVYIAGRWYFQLQDLLPLRVFKGSFIDVVRFPPQLSHWVGRVSTNLFIHWLIYWQALTDLLVFLSYPAELRVFTNSLSSMLRFFYPAFLLG